MMRSNAKLPALELRKNHDVRLDVPRCSSVPKPPRLTTIQHATLRNEQHEVPEENQNEDNEELELLPQTQRVPKTLATPMPPWVRDG